jgi:TonB-linked SusC/RagA family outer membrane protein
MDKNKMENKGTGRVCLRALPFLMALSGSVCLTPLWASEAVKPSEEVLVQAQKKKISGVVKDETGEPVIGASVLIKGSMYGVITNIDGMFELSCPIKSSDVLVVSFVGMKTVEQPVGNNTKFNVVMHAAATDLEEIVVVGYGTSSVRDLTGSVASIGAKQLDQLNTTNVSSMLQNLASGVQVAQGTGKPGETVRVRVRGATSLTGSNEPLYVIDGVPIDDPAMLDAISPNDIQSMDVLKDASAAAIYGSRAANGVVIITTRKGTEGKPTVNFNYNFTIDSQIKNFRILYGDEWRETVRKFAEQTLVFDPSNDYAPDILDPESGALGTANTDWFKEVYQPGFRHNVDLSVSGGTQKAKYMLSLAILDQQGMIKGGDLTRYNTRISTELSVLPILRFGLNATMSYTDQSNAGTSLFSA